MSKILLKLQHQLAIAKEIVAHTMIGSCAVLLDAEPMFLGRVTCIVVPAIEWELLVELNHIVIAVCLGKD